MCSAAGPARISLDLLPDTSVRATSDGLHARTCRGGSAAAGSWPHAASGRDQPCATLPIQEHPSPSRDTAAGHVPSPASPPGRQPPPTCLSHRPHKCSWFPTKLNVLNHTEPPRAASAWQRTALPRRRSKEPARFRELRIIKGNVTSRSAIGSERLGAKDNRGKSMANSCSADAEQNREPQLRGQTVTNQQMQPGMSKSVYR